MAPHASDPANLVRTGARSHGRRLPATGSSEQKDTVIRIAAATAAANQVDDVLELAAEEALRALGAASLSISRFEHAEAQVRTLINVGSLGPGEVRWPADETYPFADFPLVARLVRERRPYFNSLADPGCDLGALRVLTALGKGSDLGVPIEVDGTAWGEIWASRGVDEPGFTESDALFLGLIAEQVAIVVARALELSRVSTLAYEDELTGIPNRRAFERELTRLRDQAGEGGGEFCLLLCDVDGLKRVNDVDGHDAGDRVLRRVATSLERAARLRPETFVARVSGDEFGILIGDGSLERAVELGTQLIAGVRAETGAVSMSCGAAAGDAHTEAAALMAGADTALYAAKQQGGGRACSLTAMRSQRARRKFRGRPGDRIRAAASEVASSLDGELAGAPVLARLEHVAVTLAEAADFASWAISVVHPGSDRLVDLSIGENRGRGYEAVHPGPDTGQYPLTDYPATAAIVAAGSGCYCAQRDDPACEPGERRLLEDYGMSSVAAAVGASAGCVYLVELYGDEFTVAPSEVCTTLRLLTRAAMPPFG